jgi:hypothetical protein
MKGDAFHQLLDLTTRLREARIFYSLRQSRDEAVRMEVVVPGQRWEIELVDYGDEVHVEIERFISTGNIESEAALDDLFASFSDVEEEAPAK